MAPIMVIAVCTRGRGCEAEGRQHDRTIRLSTLRHTPPPARSRSQELLLRCRRAEQSQPVFAHIGSYVLPVLGLVETGQSILAFIQTAKRPDLHHSRPRHNAWRTTAGPDCVADQNQSVHVSASVVACSRALCGLIHQPAAQAVRARWVIQTIS